MISKNKKQIVDKEEEKPLEKTDSVFEELIKNVIGKEGYIKEADLKAFTSELLEQIEPLISKYVKHHLFQIGNYITEHTEPLTNKKIGEDKDAQTS